MTPLRAKVLERLRQRRRAIGTSAACLLAITLATAGIAVANLKPSTKGLDRSVIEVTAERLNSFDKLGDGATRFGRLQWRGGLVLTSPSEHFGGWSGLELSSDGRTLLAISDAGTWMRAGIDYDGRTLSGLRNVEVGPLKARDGKRLKKDRDRDAEGLSLMRGDLRDGEVLISFEHHDRIGRFPVRGSVIGAPLAYLDLPKDMVRQGRDGVESLAVLQGGPMQGALVAIMEHPLKGTARHQAWIWLHGRPRIFAIVNRDDYAITDAASLADGSLIILERRYRVFDGVRLRLREISASDVAPGAELDGEVLLEADLRHEIDNMEGLAVHASPEGETVLTIISDDNFNPLLQRTILLQFTLKPSEHAKGANPL